MYVVLIARHVNIHEMFLKKLSLTEIFRKNLQQQKTWSTFAILEPAKPLYNA